MFLRSRSPICSKLSLFYLLLFLTTYLIYKLFRFLHFGLLRFLLFLFTFCCIIYLLPYIFVGRAFFPFLCKLSPKSFSWFLFFLLAFSLLFLSLWGVISVRLILYLANMYSILFATLSAFLFFVNSFVNCLFFVYWILLGACLFFFIF